MYIIYIYIQPLPRMIEPTGLYFSSDLEAPTRCANVDHPEINQSPPPKPDRPHSSSDSSSNSGGLKSDRSGFQSLKHVLQYVRRNREGTI